MEKSEMSPQRKIVEEWCERVWAQEDASAIDYFFEDDGIAGGLGRDKLAGPEDFHGFHQAICALICDIRLTIVDYMEQGNKLSCICTFGGTHRASGKHVEMDGAMYMEFRGDKILHCENHFEFMDFYEQMGMLPENSFAKALGGERVA